MVKAMILAAGKGTRVAPFTLTTPKPLLKVFGQPVIENLIGFLRRNQVEEVAINTSYMGDKIQEFLGDGSRYDMEFTYSFEGSRSNRQLISTPRGSAGGMREIQQKYAFFDDTFIVICGDAIIDFDLDYALALHRSRGSLATVMVKEVPDEKLSSYGVVDMDDSGLIHGFQEKPDTKDAVSNLVSTGIYLFEPEIFDYIPESGDYDIGGELLPLLASRGAALYGCATPMQWIDIGNVNDLWTANLSALTGDIPYIPMKGKAVGDNLRVASSAVIDLDTCHFTGPVYIGPGAVIEPDVTITGPAIISENTHISRGSKLEKVIVDSYVKVQANAHLSNRWINTDFIIGVDASGTSTQQQPDDHRVTDLRQPAHDMKNVMAFVESVRK